MWAESITWSANVPKGGSDWQRPAGEIMSLNRHRTGLNQLRTCWVSRWIFAGFGGGGSGNVYFLNVG